MYYNSSNSELIPILAGILSLILIITFFVMAFRLKKIMEYLRPMSAIALGEANLKGMKEVTCPRCDKQNYIVFGVEKFSCKCGYDLIKGIKTMEELKKKGEEVPV